jgi:hypothetical protein
MKSVIQSMAKSAAKRAVDSIVAGSDATERPISPPFIPVAVTMVIAVVVVIVCVSILPIDNGRKQPICPNITEFDIYPGRLDIYFATPLEPLAVDVGRQLEDLVADRYNDTYGCDSLFSRLMLNSTLICGDSECCQLVNNTDSGNDFV